MPRRRDRGATRVAMAASPGGHVDLLVALAEAVEGCERVWVLPESARMAALRAQGERVDRVRPYGRSPLRSLGNVLDALRSLARGVPDVVVTSGAGVVVPYCVLARALGARLIFAETMARVHTGSMTGRLLTRLAETTLVQWPESRSTYPGARVCSPPLLAAPDGDAAGDAARAGTFVALGTHAQPFHRLLTEVERAAAAGLLPRPVTAQIGDVAADSEILDTVGSVPPARLRALMAGADVVVCHAGAGLIATALRAGRRPLVLARRAALGEHVDDHQQEIVDKLASLELARDIRGGITAEDVAAARGDVSGRLPLPGESMPDALAELLRDGR